MPLNKEQYNLRANDIKGATPKCVAFNTNRIGTNPLDPEYKVQAVQQRAPTPPRFLRDGINIGDIQGTCPKRMWKGGETAREVNVVDDVPGARSVKRTMERKTTDYNPLNWQDVTHNKSKWTR